MRLIIDRLLAAASMVGEEGGQTLGLAAPLDLGSYFLDTTCVKLNIHFPVDLTGSAKSKQNGGKEDVRRSVSGHRT